MPCSSFQKIIKFYLNKNEKENECEEVRESVIKKI